MLETRFSAFTSNGLTNKMRHLSGFNLEIGLPASSRPQVHPSRRLKNDRILTVMPQLKLPPHSRTAILLYKLVTISNGCCEVPGPKHTSCRAPRWLAATLRHAMTDQQLWDAVVIGSGIGGLVTASQLAAKGAKVLVLERYLIPGGSGGAFKRDGYTFDVGASMIFGFGQKGYTNLLTRALPMSASTATPSQTQQLEYHMPGLNIAHRHYDSFIAEPTARFPHEATGIRKFYDTCWQVFNCLDAMPLLSLEDPAYLTKVFFKAPLACLGLARWLPFNVGAVARQHIKDEQLLKFIDIECFCWSVMPADRTPMINAGMVFSDRHAGGSTIRKVAWVSSLKNWCVGWSAMERHPLQGPRHRNRGGTRTCSRRDARRRIDHPRPSGDFQCHALGHLLRTRQRRCAGQPAGAGECGEHAGEGKRLATPPCAVAILSLLASWRPCRPDSENPLPSPAS